MSAAGQSGQLGWNGSIECRIGVTDEPWFLDLDAIVVSVGSGLGQLAESLYHQFPDTKPEWSAVDFDSITPDRPKVLTVSGGRATDLGVFGPQGVRTVRIVVLATPHQGRSSEPTDAAIAIATSAAVRAAAESGATAVGLPLLATGDLRRPPQQVASIAVPAVVDTLAQFGTTNLRRLVFICRENRTATAIRLAWQEQFPDGTAIDDVERVPASPATASGNDEPAPATPRYSAVDLAGGVSSDLVDPNTGIPLSRDHLGVAPYVSMLATVIAARNTPLPLSVGIFGEWGSGKSYFMAMLRNQVDQLSGSSGSTQDGDQDGGTYCSEIVQIGFNAWHYADSNLWASLGDEIFRQLAGPGQSTEQRRARLRAELGERLNQRTELAAATEQAGVEAASLQAEVDSAVADRRVAAGQLVRALRESTTFHDRVDRLWQRLGVADQAEQAALLAEEVRGTLDETEVLHRSPRRRSGTIAFAGAVLVLAAAAVVAVLAPELWQWVAGTGAVVAGLLGFGLTALGQARAGVRDLRDIAADLRSGVHAAAPEPEVAERLAALRRAEADQRVAQAQLDEVIAKIGELGRELAELTPGRRLYSFLAERAHGGSYAGNLGLISTIRKDFQQLVELMADWRENPHPDEGRQPIDRIVLYIDDLDRCSPRQVVDVLQAVHLLLALDLFVVVVGVDPRWLLRSLASRYDEILDGGVVTPEDYLEKILNIPLVLPGMPTGSLHRLIRSMVEEAPAPQPSPTEPAVSTDRPPGTYPVPGLGTAADVFPVESGSAVDAQLASTRAPAPRPLTEPEITLLAALDQLVDTPREAKRLINLYRMLRATRDLSDASQFLGEDGRPGEYQAVVILLGLLTAHARLLGAVLDAPRTGAVAGGLVHRPRATRWADFVADLEPVSAGQGWTNGIVGAIATDEVSRWSRLHRGLAAASAEVGLPDLTAFQRWEPRIRRFSYALTSVPVPAFS